MILSQKTPITINYWFSVGYRCNATDFSVKYGFRKMSSPFDYMFLDFNSMLRIIHNKFDDFLNDTVVLDGHYNTLINYKSKNHVWVKPEFYPLLKMPIRYVRESFLKTFIRFNQNYTTVESGESFTENMYDWPNICIHNHHNVTDDNVLAYMQTRCDRFLKAFETNYKKTILFHITKILSGLDIRQEIMRVLELKNKYNNRAHMVYIMCCDDKNNDHFFVDRCLFIVKQVPYYDTQFEEHGTENDIKYLNYDKENQLIREYFEFDLVEKEQM
jgi:hypothetical protein